MIPYSTEKLQQYFLQDYNIAATVKSVSDYRLRLRLDWNLTNQKKENQSQV